MLSRLGGHFRRIDQDDEFGGVARVFGFAETDGFESCVLQFEILGKVIAHDFRAGFGENANFVGIALRFRGGDAKESGGQRFGPSDQTGFERTSLSQSRSLPSGNGRVPFEIEKAQGSIDCPGAASTPVDCGGEIDERHCIIAGYKCKNSGISSHKTHAKAGYP